MRKPPVELRKFLAPYGASIARLFFAARRAVLAAAPDATELIYDAYNAVSAVYSFNDRMSDAFCHVAAYREHVNLGFNKGAALPDPERLLVGSGTNIRHIRIGDTKALRYSGVARLISAAVVRARTLNPPSSSKPRSFVKAVYAKKRRP